MTEEEINKIIQDIKNQLAKLEPSIKTFSESAKKQFENMKGKFHHAKTKFEESKNTTKRNALMTVSALIVAALGGGFIASDKRLPVKDEFMLMYDCVFNSHNRYDNYSLNDLKRVAQKCADIIYEYEKADSIRMIIFLNEWLCSLKWLLTSLK